MKPAKKIDSRRKGHDFERRIARELSGIYPDAKRGFQARDGRDAPDVDGTPFWLECGHGKRMNPAVKYAQACAATDGRPPVAITRVDNGPIVVTMGFDLFLRMLLVLKEE